MAGRYCTEARHSLRSIGKAEALQDATTSFLQFTQLVASCEREPEAGTGCADENDYCVTYEGMNWYFSGDKQLAPVFEKLSLQGRTRSAVILSN